MADKTMLDLMASAGKALADSFTKMTAPLPRRKKNQACALVARIRKDPEKFQREGAIEAAAAKIAPEDKAAARDWAGFFAGLAALFAQIGPMFLKA